MLQNLFDAVDNGTDAPIVSGTESVKADRSVKAEPVSASSKNESEASSSEPRTADKAKMKPKPKQNSEPDETVITAMQKKAPVTIAKENWSGFYEIARKFTETELHCMCSLIATVNSKERSISDYGRKLVNDYLNAGADRNNMKSSLALAKYRIERADEYTDRKFLFSDQIRERISALVREIAFDLDDVESAFGSLPESADVG